MTPERPAAKENEWETRCPKSSDGKHCEHWYDGTRPCCYCDDDSEPIEPEVGRSR